MSERLKSFFRKARENPEYRKKARMAAVSADLRILIAEKGLRHQEVAQAIGMSPAGLSRQLSGSANLTLESIGKICDALGKEFDIVFRNADDQRALQAWERRSYSTDVLRLRNEALGQAAQAKALLETAMLVHRRSWQAAQDKRRQVNAGANLKKSTWTLSNDTLAAAA